MQHHIEDLFIFAQLFLEILLVLEILQYFIVFKIMNIEIVINVKKGNSKPRYLVQKKTIHSIIMVQEANHIYRHRAYRTYCSDQSPA